MVSARRLEYKGQSKTLKEWADELGVTKAAVENRLAAGWSIKDTVTTRRKRPVKYITYKNKTLCENQWAKKLDINQNTIRQRHLAGWTPGQILGFANPPKRKRILCAKRGCEKSIYRVKDGCLFEFCQEHQNKLDRYGNTDHCVCLTTDPEIRREYYRWGSLKINAKKAGVSVDPQWLKAFDYYYKDMGKCPKGKILSRRDFSKGYNKENCFWSTKSSHAKRSNAAFAGRKSSGQ